MKKRIAIALALCLLGCATALFADTLQFPIPGNYLEQEIKANVFVKAAQAALLRYNWRMVESSAGQIVAEYIKQGIDPIVLRIKINYTQDSYSFDYVDSKNLDAGKMANGKIRIHKKVRSWIANLNKAIAINYLTSASAAASANAADPGDAGEQAE